MYSIWETDRVCEPAILQLLSKCHRLSSFLLDLFMMNDYHQPAQWFAPMVETLTRACSSHLTEFIIQCFLNTDNRRSMFIPWHVLDNTLSSQTQFPKLGKLHVVVNGVWGSPSGGNAATQEAACAHLESMMPQLIKAGRLDVRRPRHEWDL